MIGNDIVDLRQARRESNWQRPRYLNKLFTEQEQEWIARAREPEVLIWLFWSSKEAAYKKWSAQQRQRVFIPKKVSVKNWQPTGEGRYRSQLFIGETTYAVHSTVTENYIHSWTMGEDGKAVNREVIWLGEQHPSRAVRGSVARRLVNQEGWSVEDITFLANELGQPFLFHKNEPVPLSLSLSHHGGYGAFAYVAAKLSMASPLE